MLLDTWILGYLATWLLGYLVTWLLGYLATWLLGYLATWLLGYLVAWILGYLVTWLLGYLGTWFIVLIPCIGSLIAKIAKIITKNVGFIIVLKCLSGQGCGWPKFIENSFIFTAVSAFPFERDNEHPAFDAIEYEQKRVLVGSIMSTLPSMQSSTNRSAYWWAA